MESLLLSTTSFDEARLIGLLYLEPSTGGFILQFVLASIAAGLVFIRLLWARFQSVVQFLTSFLRKSSEKSTENNTPPDDGPNEEP